MANTVTSASAGPENLEVIEWDIPVNEIQNSEDINYIGLSKLSMNTEIKTRYWENATKYLNHHQQYSGSSNSSPLFDQNQNFTYEVDINNQIPNFQVYNSSSGAINTDAGLISKSNSSHHHQFRNDNDSPVLINQRQNSTKIQGKTSQAPLLIPQSSLLVTQAGNSPITANSAISECKTPEILSSPDDITIDFRKVNETQTIKEQLLEMKSIIKKLATQTEDITGLPEPVQLALKVIELETTVQDRDTKIESLEETIADLRNEIERNNKEYEFQLNKSKSEINNMKEKLEIKTESLNKRNYASGNTDRLQIEKLKEELKNVKEANEQQLKEMNEKNQNLEHCLQMLKLDVSSKEKEAMKSKELLKEHQTSELYQKNEVRKYLNTAREGMERERQDRYLLLVEQNKLKHKVEKLSENCKSYQIKNEELCRIQNELEQECDQFRKLKKMIQEHGLPNHEQLIVLQQQTEMFKDDMLSERKDRERAQAQREKMRRDLEILQSRNQSLQEQVYKYQEHIMRLNTGDRRYANNQEFIPLNQVGGHGGRFSRQLSSPAYFNPKIRMDGTQANVMKGSSMNQAIPNRQGSPVGGGSTNRMINGVPNVVPERGRRQGGYNNSSQFDPWQQQRNGGAHQQQNVLTQQPRNGTMHNPLGNINRTPRSPLLGPNGDPWYPSHQSPTGNPQQQSGGQVTSNGFTYPSNIWSQQPPQSPSAFANKTLQSSPKSSSPGWQYSSGDHAGNNFHSPTGSNDATQSDNLSAIPGGETWSTITEDSGNVSSNPSEYQDGSEAKDNKESADSAQIVHPIDGFQCGKCNTKCDDTEAFRGHIEKCFN